MENDLPQMLDTGLRDLLDTNPIGALILERDTGKMLLANKAFVQLIGAVSIKDLELAHLSKTWKREEDFQVVRDCLRTGEPVIELEAERTCLDGVNRWVLINSQPTVFENKEAIIFWQFDITKRKVAEQQVLENEERIQQIFDTSPVAIGITRESDATIQYANDKYATMLGYTHDEIQGHNAAEMWVDIEERNRFKRIFEEHGFVDQQEARGRKKDGSIIWVSISWKSVQYKNEPCHLFWIYDISKQKENERILSQAKEDAETATKAKSEFLAAMSHEIRTPLNGVLGLAELLSNSELNEDQQNKVDTILSSGQTLLAILNDVLDMSKIESGNIDLENRDFNLSELISSVCTPFQSLADQKDIDLQVTSTFDQNIGLVGDPTRLRQILWNLISNAIKFTDTGSVKLSIEQKKSQPKEKLLCFEVQDTGLGIAEDRIEEIFSPFTQADRTITRKHGGTGLGLTIVNQLVSLMGGHIELESEIGKGSKFIVQIPFGLSKRTKSKEKLKNEKSDNQARKSLKILMAEDNEVNAMITRAFLEQLGHKVQHVENGKKAVEEAAHEWADLILMDVHMPEMNGLDATREIRDSSFGKTVPIIGLTAEAFSDRHENFMEIGMTDVLTKPFTNDQLQEKLQRYS